MSEHTPKVADWYIDQIESLTVENKRLQSLWAGSADIIAHLHAENQRLQDLVDSLEPQHHYMTKFGAELQETTTRLTAENKRLREALEKIVDESTLELEKEDVARAALEREKS